MLGFFFKAIFGFCNNMTDEEELNGHMTDNCFSLNTNAEKEASA